MNHSMKTRFARRHAVAPLLSALLMGIAVATPATAQTTTATTTTTTTSAKAQKLDHQDENFLKEAAESGLTEIEGGKTGTGKATHADVKAFAQMLVDDHTKANIELASLAASKGVKLPTDPSLVDKAKLKVLGMREAASFDSHFVKTLGVDAHEKTIKLFEKQVKEGKDPDIKAFAAKTLPTLQQHLQHAKDLHGKVDTKK